MRQFLYRHAPLAAFFSALTFAYTAFAQADVLADPIASIDGVAKLVLDAIANKNYGLLAAVVVSIATFGLRKWPWLGAKVPFLKTKLGGILLPLVGSIAGALATSLAAGQPITVGLVVKAVTVGVTASGAWAIFKNAMEHANDDKAAEAGAAAAVKPEDTLNR